MAAPQQNQPIQIARRGLMLVISSPSGAGKSTIARNLLEADSGISLSISVTTRQRRPSEIAGRHYHFIDRAEFDMLRDSDALLEWAEVHGNFYGTPRKPVEEAMAAGRDMLFDIDWQGAQQLQDKMSADVVSIFILPPSIAELDRRLRSRAQDSDEVIAGRMAKSRDEISHWAEYDYVLVNEDLVLTFERLKAILTAERLKRERQPQLSAFVRSLNEEFEAR